MSAAGEPATNAVAQAALPISLEGIHHVGVAVRDLDAAIEHYRATFGAALELRAVLDEQQVEAASLHVGDQLVELIAPTSDAGSVATFLERRGEGMHHLAFAVRDVRASLAALAAAQVRLVDQAPRVGLHGTDVAFVHPSATFGVLVELVELAGPAGKSAEGAGNG